MRTGTFLKATILIAAAILSGPARAQTPHPKLEALARTMASHLAAACPMAAPDDLAAFRKCVAAVRTDHSIPFGDRLLWGGDQPQKPIKKKGVTNFQKDVFQLMYLPLFAFSGEWTITHDDLDDVDVIRVDALFRNRLPPGEYPYPFWHSADKWADYEAARGINFYIADGRVVLATRAHEGYKLGNATYAHRDPPVFDGKWQWVDANGKTEPEASLFSNKYSKGNPFLPKLDASYRTFALAIRDGSCIRCHAPNNRSEMDRLILLQTPVHAAAEINDVIKVVRAGDMPRNDFGLKKPLDPQLRDAILTYGEQFRGVLEKADKWEAARPNP